MRLVESSDEDDSDEPPTKKQLVNGHDSSSKEDSPEMPDEDRIDRFIQMWETVYPLVEKMVR